MSVTLSLKPKDLGVTGKFNSITAYKTKLVNSINEKYVDLLSKEGKSISNDRRIYLANYFSYLTFLSNFFDNNERSFSNFSTIKSEDLNEIKVYGAEIFGPVYLPHTKGIEVAQNDSVDMPVSSTEPGIDFTVGTKKISVKKSTGVTNTLKPSEIVSNRDFRTYCTTRSDLKKVFDIFVLLNEESAVQGAIEVVLENKLPNLDSKLTKVLNHIQTIGIGNKQLEQDIQSIVGNISFNSMEDVLYKLSEKAIEDWSKLPQNKNTIKDFANAYLKFAGVSLFSLSIARTTGSPEPKLASTVSSAIIKSKGKHASRINSKGKLISSSEKLGVMFEKMDYA